MRDDHLERKLNRLRDDTLAGPFKDWHFTPEMQKKVLEKVERERGKAKGFFSVISERRWGMAATAAALVLVVTLTVGKQGGPGAALDGLRDRFFSPKNSPLQELSVKNQEAPAAPTPAAAWQTIDGAFYAGQIADLNGDGRNELLLVANEAGQNEVQTWTFSGGSFSKNYSLAYGDLNDTLAVGDTNGNGVPEIIGAARDTAVKIVLTDATGTDLGARSEGSQKNAAIDNYNAITMNINGSKGEETESQGEADSDEASPGSGSGPEKGLPGPTILSGTKIPEQASNEALRKQEFKAFDQSVPLDGRGSARAPGEAIRTPNISVWEGSSESKVIWKGTAAGMIWDLSITDVTGDSVQEVVVVGNLGTAVDPGAPGFLEIWQWDNTRPSGNEYVLMATATNFASANTGVVVRDLDGDRNKEVLVSNLSEGLLAYHVEKGKLVPFWAFAELSGRLQAADLDGDEVPEVVLWGDGILRVLRMKDKDLEPLDGGTLTLPERLLEVVAVADVDNDGTEDILFSREREGSFFYLTGRNRTFGLVPLDLPGRVTAVGDVDNDGKNELVVLTSDGKVQVGELGEARPGK